MHILFSPGTDQGAAFHTAAGTLRVTPLRSVMVAVMIGGRSVVYLWYEPLVPGPGVPGFGSSFGAAGFGSIFGTPGLGSIFGTPGFGSSLGTPGFGSIFGMPGLGSSFGVPGLGSIFGP